MFQFKACPHGQHAALSARRGHSARPLRIRPLVRQVHLWLGLTVGGLFAVLGLTGSALMFYVGIDEALNTPEFAATGTAAPDWDSPVWDRVLATGLNQWPQQGGKFSIEATGNSGPIPARYYPPSQHHGHHADRDCRRRILDGDDFGVLRKDVFRYPGFRMVKLYVFDFGRWDKLRPCWCDIGHQITLFAFFPRGSTQLSLIARSPTRGKSVPPWSGPGSVNSPCRSGLAPSILRTSAASSTTR